MVQMVKKKKKWFDASFNGHGVKCGFPVLVYKNLPNLSSPPAFSLSVLSLSTPTASVTLGPGAQSEHLLFPWQAMCHPAVSVLLQWTPLRAPSSPSFVRRPTVWPSGLDSNTSSSEGNHWAPHLNLGEAAPCQHSYVPCRYDCHRTHHSIL